jgi:drug/metabolite transporter (DMT)-like permease
VQSEYVENTLIQADLSQTGLIMIHPKSPPLAIAKIPKTMFLWLAVAIFGASNAVTRRLTAIGAENLVEGRNPISLCNVLFVGNLCALIVLLLLHRKYLNRAAFRQLTRHQWLGLMGVALLAGALAPGLIFQALSLTSVNNVVFIGRLEPVLTLAFSVCLFRERINRWEIGGAMAAFGGVLVILLLQPPTAAMMSMAGFKIGMGELLAGAAAVALASATMLGKKYLTTVPIGLFSLVRTGMGTIIFYILAKVLYGGNHFMDIASPFLWEWMLLYGAIIVVVGQTFWMIGTRASNITHASFVAACTPIMGIIAAFLILGEVPTLAHYLGGGMILAGLILSQIGMRPKMLHSTLLMGNSMVPMEQALAAQIGFKGI